MSRTKVGKLLSELIPKQVAEVKHLVRALSYILILDVTLNSLKRACALYYFNRVMQTSEQIH